MIEMVRMRRLLHQINSLKPARAHMAREDLEDPDIVYFVYLFYIVPLPMINFPLLWRRLRQRGLACWAAQAVVWVFRQLTRLGWFIWYLTITMWWLEDLCKFISVFGSMATYSPDYFGDIFTYSFRHWPQLLDRKLELYRRWGSEPPLIEVESFLQVLLDNASLHMRAFCSVDHEVPQCMLDTNSLIFRFSEVLERIVPVLARLPTFVLTCCTISIYFVYGIVAQFFGANVLIFLCAHSAHRWLPSIKYTTSLMKLVLNHSAGLVW